MPEIGQNEHAGLVFALELDNRGGARKLAWEEMATESTSPRWLHLDFTNPEAREWIRTKSGIDELIVNSLLDEDSRPRTIRHGKGLLVALRGVNSNPGENAEDMVSIRLWIEDNRIVSTRRRKLLSVFSLREALEKSEGPKSTSQLLVMLTQYLSERMGPVIDGLDDRVEQAELDFANDNAAPYSGEFSNLRRQAARIRRYLAPQRDALERLSRETDSVLSAAQCASIREEADQITRYLEDLDLLRERAILAQEELIGRMANEQNRRMYVLSLVAAIFLPLSFLTGMMGMNVAGLPGTENSAAFALLSLFMLVVAAGIVALFKWRRWL